MDKLIPNKLNIGDIIGAVAPSDPIINENVEEVMRAKVILENDGFKVKFSDNFFSNTNGYSATAREKADDINNMFANKDVKMVWYTRGGTNGNSVLDYLDFELIKNNPKIFCGYSDCTIVANIIHEKTGLVTYSSTNLKTIATDETDFSYKEVLKRFVEKVQDFGMKDNDMYITIKEGIAEGELVGGNLSLVKEMIKGKYSINVNNKILFIEELGFESCPGLVCNYLYYLKQNGVFKKISGLWLGSYEHESGITLEKIVLDVIGNDYDFPIIKSNNFGHIENKTVIPIGIKAKIDTSKDKKIWMLEDCVK